MRRECQRFSFFLYSHFPNWFILVMRQRHNGILRQSDNDLMEKQKFDFKVEGVYIHTVRMHTGLLGEYFFAITNLRVR